MPQVGRIKARALVAYRDKTRKQNGGSTVVFGVLDDLLAVKGFSPKILEAIEPYLIFPQTGP